MTSERDPRVRWLVDASISELAGYTQVDWAWLRRFWVAKLRDAGMQRRSLASPAQPWFDRLATVDRLAIVNVVLDGPDALADLLGFIVEPAVRLGLDLVVVADLALDDLDEEAFVESEYRYAYTLKRLQWLMETHHPQQVPAISARETRLDSAQAEAVNAGAGVIQVIAPAGSGKTTVLIQRVLELRRRGVPADRIVCLTFNKKAAREIEERLEAAEVGGTEAMTFNRLGLRIVRAAKDARDRGEPSQGQWGLLAGRAREAVGRHGVWLAPPEAEAHISDIKLGLLLSPQEYADTISETSDGLARTLAKLYTEHDRLQRERGKMDYDDQILGALRLLRGNPEVRTSWQDKWQCVLVDEYQDIEPAQELLVRIIAAPHDQLFCVGDEDQTLYAFRRASVQRIICLDQRYPGLRRIALGVNYRCPAAVVAASDRLININKVRLPKRIAAFAGEQDGTVALHPVKRSADDAAGIAQALAARSRGEIVVLARTTNALRPVALACADQGVRIDGPPKLFTAWDARGALQCHLQLALQPRLASDELVKSVCQTPGRSIKQTQAAIAKRLREGATFEEAFAGVKPPNRGDGTLLAPGILFTELAACEDAQAAVELLRGEGGLDEWFETDDEMGGVDRFECASLEEAHEEAAGRSMSDFHAQLARQTKQLRVVRDEDDGMELATIHGSKGREWPYVIVVAVDDGILPDSRASKADADPEVVGRGEGTEAERRLAYVAFTRAKQHLELHYDAHKPSPFLTEAGLRVATSQRTATRRAPSVAAQQPQSAEDALRTRRIETADLVAQRRMSRRMTIVRTAADLQLTDDELMWVLGAVAAATPRTKLRKLDDMQTHALARAIYELA